MNEMRPVILLPGAGAKPLLIVRGVWWVSWSGCNSIAMGSAGMMGRWEAGRNCHHLKMNSVVAMYCLGNARATCNSRYRHPPQQGEPPAHPPAKYSTSPHTHPAAQGSGEATMFLNTYAIGCEEACAFATGCWSQASPDCTRCVGATWIESKSGLHAGRLGCWVDEKLCLYL